MSKRWPQLAAFSMLLIVMSASASETLKFEFKDFNSPGAPYKFQGQNAEQFGVIDGKGLVMKLPAERGNGESLGVRGKFEVAGDFQITLRYEILFVQNPAPQNGCGAAIWVRFAGEPRLGATVTRTHRPEGERFVANKITTNEKGGEKYNPTFFPATENFGRIRLVRIGKLVKYYAADGDAVDFKHLFDWEANDGNITNLFIQATTGGLPAAVTVRLLDIEIVADQLPKLGSWAGRNIAKVAVPTPNENSTDPLPAPEPLVSPTPRKIWIFVAGALILVVVIGIVVFRRQKS
jgi:hypothetical protein